MDSEMSSSNPTAGPTLIVVLCGKGGVGKSLLSQVIAELHALNDLPIDIIQVDDQQRLAKVMGREIHSVDLRLLRHARKDPNVLVTAFDGLYARIERAAAAAGTVLVDVGATQQHALLDYADLIELDEELQTMGVRTIVLIPTVSETESIRQAAKQVRRVQTSLASAERVLVLNERDGRHAALRLGTAAGDLYRDELRPLLEENGAITMPLIEAGSWQIFEQHNCQFLDVIGQEISATMIKTGLSRPAAKLARGDVAAWFSKMEEALSPVLGLRGFCDGA